MMPAFTDLTGLLSGALLIGLVLLQLPHLQRLPKHYLAVVTLAIIMVSLVPLGALPLAGYIRGIVGDLSITSVVLMMVALIGPYHVPVNNKQLRHLFMVVAVAAVCLYPLALGIGLYDLYRLGYSNMFFIVAVLIFAFAALLTQEIILALCLMLATLAWSFGWYESSNLWDYLIDPLIAIYVFLQLLTRGPTSVN